ncbi:hypothetical protein ACVILE_001507 [Streptomyces sp. M18.1]
MISSAITGSMISASASRGLGSTAPMAAPSGNDDGEQSECGDPQQRQPAGRPARHGPVHQDGPRQQEQRQRADRRGDHQHALGDEVGRNASRCGAQPQQGSFLALGHQDLREVDQPDLEQQVGREAGQRQVGHRDPGAGHVLTDEGGHGHRDGHVGQVAGQLLRVAQELAQFDPAPLETGAPVAGHAGSLHAARASSSSAWSVPSAARFTMCR